MSTKDAHLYGAPRPKKAKTSHAISTSDTLSFTSQLSSLIASSSNNTQAAPARPRPSKIKDDIFATHNKNIANRAAADARAHAEAIDYAATKMDDAAWRRTKRKMEDKARLYAAMKRGDVEDADEKHMVDFDRKWAEQQEADGADSSEDDEDSDGGDEEVEYTDEFGRTRKGTRGDAAREERRRKAVAAGDPGAGDRFTARPAAPSNIIFGDTIQASAFNPDEPVAAQMEELAAKRDRELTPPEATHYDANSEVRTKGVGFFQFSGDEQERQRQMEFLERQRQETERIRAAKELEDKKEARKREIEERRKLIKEKKGKVQANRFLDSLGGEMLEKTDASSD